MKRLLYIFIQCTWGFIQTFLGFIIYLLNIKYSHESYRNCIMTYWHYNAGLSLGMFIFVPENCSERLKSHEYGHTIQSLLLGPFYLFFGLLSFVWANFAYFQKLRLEKQISYDRMFVEGWATSLGKKSKGKKSM